jgi:hypothetical protein
LSTTQSSIILLSKVRRFRRLSGVILLISGIVLFYASVFIGSTPLTYVSIGMMLVGALVSGTEVTLGDSDS